MSFRELLVSHLLILQNLFQKGISDGYNALFSSFTEDGELFGDSVDIVVGECDEFGSSHAGLVEQFDDEVVSYGEEVVGVLFEELLLLHLSFFIEGRQGFGYLGRDDELCRVVLGVSDAHEVFPEGSE